MRNIQAIRHGVLAAHGPLFFQVLFVRHGHARNRVLQSNDGINRASERQLNRSAHLPSSFSEFAFGILITGTHHCAKCAYIEEVVAHPVTSNVFVMANRFLVLLLVLLPCFPSLKSLLNRLTLFVRLFNLLVQNRPLFDEDVVSGLLLLH